MMNASNGVTDTVPSSQRFATRHTILGLELAGWTLADCLKKTKSKLGAATLTSSSRRCPQKQPLTHLAALLTCQEPIPKPQVL
ncbi:hypothetical protein H920_06049 [Fukomys damarensis]|uniref:Uncharacterized protein n=1 Tax=Fukomys damarensis TaxID=885580 RepID=A0A091DPT3_FUKDA|nr:hypothetical protein H920_06049 [Fukomys damarensis]